MILVPLAVAALVCRYTVRDIGFVDLAGATYSLALVGAEESEFAHDPLLRDTNLTFAALPALATADPRVAAAGAAGGWVLHREGLEPLRLLDVGGAPADAVARALRSDLRDALLDSLTGTFAVLVVVDGEGDGWRARVEGELAAAREGLDLLSSQLPRPIVRPLAELRVTRERRADEEVLCWALGLGTDESRPAVALIYGRGRLGGEVLVGDAIERGELLAQLALVGESCECDTERDWLGAPSLPLAWDAERRARAATDLGFDPESPLVRAEVARILERGRPAGPNAQNPIARQRGVDDVVFGYDEGALEGRVPDPGKGPAPGLDGVEASDLAGASGVRVFEATGGDDWGFQDSAAESSAGRGPADAAASWRRLDPLLLAGLAVLGLVAVGVGAVLLSRGPR